MKKLILLVLVVFILKSYCEAAPVKPRKYKIAVTTISKKEFKGIFYSINDTVLQLKKGNTLISFNAANVRKITVYNAKLPLTLALVGAAVAIIVTSTLDNSIEKVLGYIVGVPYGFGQGFLIGEIANDKAVYRQLTISDFSSISDELKPFSSQKQ